MQPSQAHPVVVPAADADGIDPLTGKYNPEWARRSHPDDDVPPEHPAYVALFDRSASTDVLEER